MLGFTCWACAGIRGSKPARVCGLAFATEDRPDAEVDKHSQQQDNANTAH
mgnify:FL=1